MECRQRTRVKGRDCGSPRRADDALAAYDVLLLRLGVPTETEIRGRVADALCSRAYWLDASGRIEMLTLTLAPS